MEDQRTAVVIEDDEDIRILLVTLLRQSGFVVHEAPAGVAGVRAVADHSPSLVTVDLGLPDIDGYEVTRRIRGFSDAYVIMLTARGEEIDTLMGLEMGADDYVVKPFRPHELRARVQAMMRRPRSIGVTNGAGGIPGPVVSPAMSAPEIPTPSELEADESAYHLDGLQLTPSQYRVSVDAREVHLTPTEFLVLKTLLASRRIVRSKVEIARILRDEDPDSDTFVAAADERAVEVHVGNLRKKLGDDPQKPRWIETVRGIGYRSAGAVRKESGAN